MKSFIIVFWVAFIGIHGTAQIPVTDGLKAGLLKALNSQKKALNKFQRISNASLGAIHSLDEAGEQSLKQTQWIKDLQTAKKLIDMMSHLICTTKELQLAMHFQEGTCLFHVKFDMIIVKVQMASDILSIIMTGYKMTRGERIRSLNDAIARYEESQRDMIELTAQLKLTNDADVVKRQLESVRKAKDYVRIKIK